MSIYLNHVQRNLDAAGISVSMFSVISGVPQATLSACLRGRLPMSGPKEAELYTLSIRCLAIANAIRPLVFEKGNGLAVKSLVESGLDEDQIRAVVAQLFPEIAP